MKKMIKTSLAIAVITTFSMAAVAKTIEAPLTPAKLLQANINATNPNAATSPFVVNEDVINAAFQANHGSVYSAVTVGGRQYLTDQLGSIITNPSETFMVSGDGVTKASDILFGLDMANAGSELIISHALADEIEKKGDLYILSDPTCGFCQKLEAEVPTYLANGIQVHYIPFPRQGISDPTNAGFSQWAAAACSDNPAKAYYEISTGQLSKYPTPKDLNAECTDVIRNGWTFAQKISATGTPYMYGVNVDGTTTATPGYVSVQQFSANMGVLIKPSPNTFAN
jgi:hypothetical protein